MKRHQLKSTVHLRYSIRHYFFALIIGFIGAGIIALIKGVKGNWDNKVKSEDMVGPDRRETENGEDSDND